MKTLVTTLSDVIQNDSLLKVNELRVRVDAKENATYDDRTVYFAFNDNSSVRIIGDSTFFSDSSMSENIGKNVDFTPDIAKYLFVENNDCELSFPNKKVIKYFRIYANSNFDIDELAYSKSLEELILNGDGVTGNIKALANLSKIKVINISSINVECKCEDILPFKDIRRVELQSIKGDVATFKNLDKLEILNVPGAKVKGDVSLLPKNVRFFNNNDITYTDVQYCSWKNDRESTANIIATQELYLTEDIDNFLINQAKCQKAFLSSDPAWYKVVSAHGKRTHASDSAIETLQAKGYSVQIDPIEE